MSPAGGSPAGDSSESAVPQGPGFTNEFVYQILGGFVVMGAALWIAVKVLRERKRR